LLASSGAEVKDLVFCGGCFLLLRRPENSNKKPVWEYSDIMSVALTVPEPTKRPSKSIDINNGEPRTPSTSSDMTIDDFLERTQQQCINTPFFKRSPASMRRGNNNGRGELMKRMTSVGSFFGNGRGEIGAAYPGSAGVRGGHVSKVDKRGNGPHGEVNDRVSGGVLKQV
jgi:hypothetical protein